MKVGKADATRRSAVYDPGHQHALAAYLEKALPDSSLRSDLDHARSLDRVEEGLRRVGAYLTTP